MNFLLEIGTEEIPDWMIPGALEHLRGIGIPDPILDATPRRLVVRSRAVPERQPDTLEKRSGPPVSAGPQAVAGFARKVGVKPEDLQVEDGYYTYTRHVPGRAMRDVLAAELPPAILGIPFPKTMYWAGKKGPRFIRPIRWIVAMLGEDIIPFEIAGVRSGDVTHGHRRLGKSNLKVTPSTYESILRENFVILSAGERREKIQRELPAPVHPDPALLDTLVYLTEYPTPILGDYDPQYLVLPEEVRTTVMRHHQKYFSAEGTHFVAVMNIDADRQGLVKRGHERVLRARFNDARFFWETDQKKKLAGRIPDLAAVTFQAKLGSYLQKTERNVALVRELGGSEAAVRAAQLAKCDLTTELVKEFTELEGIVGGLYARAQGEPEEVWQAIYDHYKPESMEDSIPRGHAGRLVSLADKLDTLRGCFSVGLIPTGSRDPFALRRAAQGVVRILVEGGLRLPLRPLLGGDQKLEEFLLDRVRYYFRDVRGYRYDEVNAVLASGWDDLADVAARLEAIQSVRPTADFEPLAASFKRIQNILRQAQFSGGAPVDPALVEHGPEGDLFAEFERVRRASSGQAYRPALEAIASMRPAVDRFFDKVLVNAPDERIRRNRLALLATLLAEFSTIADFSEIVTTS
jgi:glycyl-tRNA synthetase beta chain